MRAYPANNKKNRVKLAIEVIKNWTKDDFREYVIGELAHDYETETVFEDTYDEVKVVRGFRDRWSRTGGSGSYY